MERPQIATTRTPNQPDKFYFRLMYCEFFFGPFDTKADVATAMKKLDAWDSMWDYNCFCIINGADPLPENFVTGFPSIDKDSCKEIEQLRRSQI